MAPLTLNQRIWQLAWPMMLSNITVPLLGLVDTAVLGHLENANYLAGVALGTTLFTSIFWLFGFLRMGTCGMTAQAVGSRNIERILQLLLNSSWFAFLVASLLLISHSIWLPLGLELLAGQPSQQVSNSDVLFQAHEYAQWRVWGAPFVLLNYSIIGWFVGRQNTRVPLYMLIFANLINIILDLILVVIYDMGVTGVAIATLSADASASLLGIAFILYHYRRELPFIKGWLPHLATLKEMMLVNRYIFVRTGTLLLTFALFTSQGARFGADILAANAVLLTFLLLISSALDGFAHGAEALVGEACGEKNRSQLNRVISACLKLSAFSAIALTLIFGLAGTLIIDLLTDLPAIRTLANVYLPWLVVMPLISVWCYTYDGVFIGATQVKAMQNIMLLATFGIFIPMLGMIKLSLSNQWLTDTYTLNHALWLSMLLFMGCRSLGMHWFCQRNEMLPIK
jgi:MATE family multidrug resistance protein